MICKKHVKNIFPMDSVQPVSLYTWTTIDFTMSFIYNEQFSVTRQADMGFPIRSNNSALYVKDKWA